MANIKGKKSKSLSLPQTGISSCKFSNERNGTFLISFGKFLNDMNETFVFLSLDEDGNHLFCVLL